MCDFWYKFNSFLGENIPEIIIDILKASGYENSMSLAGINEKEIYDVEKFVGKNLRSLIEKDPQYSKYNQFTWS